MTPRALLPAALAVGIACVVSCGETLPPASASSGSDGGTDAASDGATAVVPPPAPKCPLTDCPGCSQENCADPIFMQETGSVASQPAGGGFECTMTGDGATIFDTIDRPATASKVIGLSFRLNAVNIGANPRPVARIAIEGLEDDERFEAVVSGDRIQLCEAQDTKKPASCTSGVKLTLPALLQLYGLVSSDSARGAFALGVGCDAAVQTLPVTKRFATNSAIVRLGCVEEGPDACDVALTDIVYYDAPE